MHVASAPCDREPARQAAYNKYVFESLDDGREEARRRSLLKPRVLCLGLLFLFVIGAEVGVLLGKHNFDFPAWLSVASNGLLLVVALLPLFRELYKFLRDHEER